MGQKQNSERSEKKIIHLSEIFHSIQGESTWVGFPCIFIRLSGCNLRCSYCDTKYAYENEYELTINEIIQKISKYQSTDLVEITGGEPLLQKNVYPLFYKLISKNYIILLETNGSIPLQKVPERIIKILDIKTPSSMMSDKMKWENLQYLNEKDEIKFVISDKNDFNWAMEKIRKNSLAKRNILFSPVFKKLKPKVLSRWILSSGLSIRLNLQLHKIIYNDKRRI